MALRIDFYRSDSAEGDPAPGDASRLVGIGHVSASDLDEQLLVDLVEHVDAHIGLFGIAVQGWGLIPAGQIGDVSEAASQVPSAADPVTDADVVARWSETLLGAVRRAAAAGAAFAWHTRFDSGGSADDGPEEFGTSAALN